MEFCVKTIPAGEVGRLKSS